MENMTSPGTLLSGDNATWLEDNYQTWLRTPDQLPEDWRRFFLSPELTAQSASGDSNVSSATLKKQAAVMQLINAWRTQGHLRAKLDPLGLNTPADVPSLQPGFWGLSEEDLLQEFSVTFGSHTTQMPLKQLINLLEQAWAGSQAYEIVHLENREEINWLLSRIESSNAPQADAQTCIARFEKLMAAETLERYLHTRYVGQKRFSLEGGESAIPALDTLTKCLRAQGVEEVVIGMAHRGRLNVLVNLLNKDPAQLFAEFEGKQTIGNGSGDVKYHMGYSSNLETPAGSLHVALAYNPSHLEIVNPVVLGQVRARQERRGEDGQAKVVGVLIHGDSALGGLGVNQTTFNLSQTQGYGTGGTLHLVINNQIGFTTSRLQDMRSSRYCTDIAKMVAAPVIHVNGDDVDSVLTILLPHGYDGQGPEHSSARPERWLQLCAENNMQVVMPSESAQMFHLLRGQVLRPMRKPLVVVMSKRLLRFKGAMSELSAFTDGAFKPVITEPQPQNASQIKRVILCSGQVYYDVLDARKQRGLDDDVAIVRVEQLYPFPAAELNDVLANWPECNEWIWLQEEPENQGAWRQIRHELAALKINHPYWHYAGRPAAAAPATGYGRVHKQQIDEFLAAAFADIQL
ncbi:thiamine pyrophosphate-dependent enzyme [Escherichia albertii]|nr:thiamine pyrophosphate-dependent enzyme [Escherichia albertii]